MDALGTKYKYWLYCITNGYTMKVRRRIGPKGQVVIPKEFREELGLRAGVEVIMELRGREVVIRKAEPYYRGDDFINYYIVTEAPKLVKPVDLKKILEEELGERHGLLGR